MPDRWRMLYPSLFSFCSHLFKTENLNGRFGWFQVIVSQKRTQQQVQGSAQWVKSPAANTEVLSLILELLIEKELFNSLT